MSASTFNEWRTSTSSVAALLQSMRQRDKAPCNRTGTRGVQPSPSIRSTSGLCAVVGRSFRALSTIRIRRCLLRSASSALALFASVFLRARCRCLRVPNSARFMCRRVSGSIIKPDALRRNEVARDQGGSDSGCIACQESQCSAAFESCAEHERYGLEQRRVTRLQH